MNYLKTQNHGTKVVSGDSVSDKLSEKLHLKRFSEREQGFFQGGGGTFILGAQKAWLGKGKVGASH